MSEMTEMHKKQYCKGDYTWCGRYMVFKALERELEICSSSKEYSGYPGITKGWSAYSSRLFVLGATAFNVKYTLIGRSKEK